MKDIFDFRPPPAVDGLIVVPHGEQIAVYGSEQTDDLELHGIGVLKLVHEDIAEPAAEVLPRVRVVFEEQTGFVQKIVEVEGVVFPKVLLIAGVYFHDLVDIPFRRVFGGVLGGRKPQHFGVADMPFDVLQQFFVFVFAFLKGFFDDIGALRFAVNGKILIQSRLGGVHSQNPHAHTVNGTHPHSPRVHDFSDALFHLVRRLIGEGDGENRLGGHVHIPDQMGDAGG